MNALFPKNEGTIDRGARVALGLVLLALVFIGPQTPWALIGLVPLYRVFGVSTCGIESHA